MENRDTLHSPRVRILVVDDHPSTAITLARAISQLGPDVEAVSASSGKEALELAARDSVDVLITDMMMPGMNGLELIEKMKISPGGRPAHIILVTAYDVPGLKETARRLKVDETIIKPVRPESICQTVSKVMTRMGRAPAVTPAAESEPSKILIADDNPDNVTLMARYMQNEGYRYITASTGVEALQKTRAEMPDLVLLDVNMPEKDGFAVLEEIRLDPAIGHIPVIVFTAARLHSDDIQSGLNLGADDYITKPFDRRELFARIRAKLRTKTFEDAIRRSNRELSVLPEIGKELSARLDINELTTVVLRRTVETLGAIMGHIAVLDPHHPLQKTYHASTPTSTPVEFPNLEGFLNGIIESRQGLILDDIQNEPRWRLIPNDPTRSAAMVPMFGRHNLLGLLVLAHEKTHYFQMEHLLLLQAIASQAAIAIENALLYEDAAQQQKRLAAVLQSAADAILMFDAGGRLSLLNPAAEKLFTDYEAKLGMPLARGRGYDALIGLLEETLTYGRSKTGEIIWPDQRIFTALFTPIEEGGSVALLHDVSHFKILERAKNEFISAASHDLKNPIGVISGFSELIPKVGPLNETQMEFVHHIYSAAEGMGELVQNLLELAKMDMGMEFKQETTDVNSLALEIFEEFQPQAESKKQVLLLEKAEDQPKVKGDALKLKQALRNLAGNAVKYTPVGGSIELSVGTEGGAVVIHVKDTGCGIPADDLPLIFNRFYRVRNNDVKDIEGNGLGLAIVRSIIEQHGGRISVISEQGKGSCFTLALPLAQLDSSPTSDHGLSKPNPVLAHGH